MEKIKKFFKTLNLYLFCLSMIYTGYFLQTDRKLTFKELWKLCEEIS